MHNDPPQDANHPAPPSRRMPAMSLDDLADLFERTHAEMQGRAGRAVDLYLVVRNWLFGWYVVEFEQGGSDRAAYGEGLIRELSRRLSARGMKGVSTTNIKQFRSFYLSRREIGQAATDLSCEGEAKSQALTDLLSPGAVTGPDCLQGVVEVLVRRFRLSWTHCVVLLTIDDAGERRFYEIEAAANQWSVRELERQIASSLYERLALSRDREEVARLAREGQVVEKAADLIKNPLVLEFLGLEAKRAYSETDLESAIIDRLESFLLELGKGFLFEARQKRFTFDNDHFFVDLVFYNRLLRCYVLVDLKRDKLTHQDLGQMQMYVNYFDRHVKLDDELPTVGIVLCRRKNDALVELTLPKDANIFAPKYQLYLPSKQELKIELERITEELEEGGSS